MSYEAEGDKIYVLLANDKRELFITIHPTDTGGTMTVEQQAEQIADNFNGKIVDATLKIAEIETAAIERAARALKVIRLAGMPGMDDVAIRLNSRLTAQELRSAEVWAMAFFMATANPDLDVFKLATAMATMLMR